jgi:hypothetical protein
MNRILLVIAAALALDGAQRNPGRSWRRLSTPTGGVPRPNPGVQQCTATVFDIDRDRVNDFVITKRTVAPAVGYRRSATGWTPYVLEAAPMHIGAGPTFFDADDDGDLDFAVARRLRWYDPV